MSDAKDSAHQPFTLTFRSEMDRFPTGGAAYATVTRVSGQTGRAVMSINRWNPNLPKPIGLFGNKLTREASEAISASVEATKWAELPPAKGGDISGAQLTIEYTRGGRVIRREFNSYNLELVRALGPVMSAIDTVLDQVTPHPLRALQLGIKRTPTGFRVSFRNTGTGPILMADPRLPAAAPGTGTRGRVQVTAVPASRPGFDPPIPQPTFVELEPATGTPPPVTLAPGQTLELDTVPWKPAGPGDYVASASWVDYVGPTYDPHAVMDATPDPSHVDDSRPYVIRGGTFSTGINVKVDRGR